MKKNNTKTILGGLGLVSSIGGAIYNNIIKDDLDYIYID